MLKSETISLAVSLELPLLIVDIQRGGPSTGLPTKTEAADLNLAMFGRSGEAPLPIVAASSPVHCFTAAIEAVRIALKYRTPVILLSDGYLANGSEPWRLPDVADLPDIHVPFATEKNHIDADGETEFWPYLRDPETLARPWAIPGTPGLMHRIGGIEKEDGSGNISYTPANHQHMVDTRAAKVAARRQGHPAARDRRRRGRRPARRRLGLDVGVDRRRGAAPSSGRAQGRVGPPHAPQSAAIRPRRDREAVPAGDDPRAEQGPAGAASSAPSSSSTPVRCRRSRASRSRRGRSKTAIESELNRTRVT